MPLWAFRKLQVKGCVQGILRFEDPGSRTGETARPSHQNSAGLDPERFRTVKSSAGEHAGPTGEQVVTVG